MLEDAYKIIDRWINSFKKLNIVRYDDIDWITFCDYWRKKMRFITVAMALGSKRNFGSILFNDRFSKQFISDPLYFVLNESLIKISAIIILRRIYIWICGLFIYFPFLRNFAQRSQQQRLCLINKELVFMQNVVFFSMFFLFPYFNEIILYDQFISFSWHLYFDT